MKESESLQSIKKLFGTQVITHQVKLKLDNP